MFEEPVHCFFTSGIGEGVNLNDQIFVGKTAKSELRVISFMLTLVLNLHIEIK